MTKDSIKIGRIAIPEHEFEWQFSRSSGPGGQNVNKVNTRATLRWNVEASRSLPADVQQRFLAKYSNRITNDGDLVIHSGRYRDRPRNMGACIEQLKTFIESVITPPKHRKPTKPSKTQKEKRLKNKKERSERKQSRQKISGY